MNDNPRRTRLLFTLLIFTSLILLTVDYQGNTSSPLRPLERGVAVVIGPAQRAIGNGTTAITGGIHFGTDQTNRIAALQDENQKLTQTLATTDQMRNELKQLKDLSALTDKWQTVPARVIGRGSAPSDEWTLLIDIGSADGVKVEATVVTGAGLLGKVIKINGRHQSTVRLLNDPNIGVAINIARNGEPGFVLGNGDAPMQLTLDSATADMKVGDVIVTRGSAKNVPYYPGIAVGTVTKISASPGSSFRVADVTPFAQAGTLEFIGVITGPGPDVPRRPLPTTSPSTPSPATTGATPSSTPSPGATG
jgi:rod shape-determining protein MreC